ncbi:MAG: HAD family phosphatase [Ruminococcus sp.]|nr:HAD family phosphatase [Ruminococcus sp.]
MKDRILGVIFDMDGLMLDTEKLYTRFWKKAAEYYGFEMTDEHILGIRSMAAKFACTNLKGILGDSFDYYAVREKRRELMDEYIAAHGVEKKQGLDDLLKELLQRSIKLAVATATNRERTENYLRQTEVIDYFDVIVTGDMIQNGKPAPDIYQTAAKALGLDCTDCIALEDSPNGILSAYRAGCKPVMIPDLSQPDQDTKALLYHCFPSLTDFCDKLDVLL